jgi:hypothetical protein
MEGIFLPTISYKYLHIPCLYVKGGTMKKHTPEVKGSGVQLATIILLPARPGAHRNSIDFAGSGPDTKSTGLPPGGMTKVRVPELNRISGSDTFTHSQSFGPEPVVGFGG